MKKIILGIASTAKVWQGCFHSKRKETGEKLERKIGVDETKGKRTKTT